MGRGKSKVGGGKTSLGASNKILNGPVESVKITKELPKLQGSEKQVKWATDIRNDYIKRTNILIEDYKKRYENGSSELSDTAITTVQRFFSSASPDNIRREIMVDGNPLYEKYKKARAQARESGDKEKKHNAVVELRRNMAEIALKRIQSTTNDTLKNTTSAAEWIDGFKWVNNY